MREERISIDCGMCGPISKDVVKFVVKWLGCVVPRAVVSAWMLAEKMTIPSRQAGVRVLAPLFWVLGGARGC